MRFWKRTTWVPWDLKSGNALDLALRNERDAVAWLSRLRMAEPNGYQDIAVIQFDRKGKCIGGISMRGDWTIEYL